jgi:tetratricopeptide (TPR) repeat protein
LRWTARLIPVCLVLVLVYWPGLGGSFQFDDNSHIVKNLTVAIESLAPGDLWRAWHASALPFPHSRPLAMVSFGINHAFSGMDPFAFKATNLVLHILIGLTVFFTARRLGSLFLSLEGKPPAQAWAWGWLTAALWLLHPINLSTVLYVVQRMTQISALCVVLGLLTYAIGRERLVERKHSGWWWIGASSVFAGVGLLAKENALLLPILLLVTEWTLFRWRGLTPATARILKLMFLAVVVVPTLLLLVYLLINPGIVTSGYATRPFSLEERLLTESRVLWLYLRMLVAPDITLLGLYHDDIAFSRSLVSPWTTLPAVAGLLGIALGAMLLRNRRPIFAFATLFFLAGHALESTVLPLEIAFEHRNYLPALAPIFALAYVATVPTLPAQSRRAMQVLVGCVLVLFGAVTAMRAADWSTSVRFAASELDHHPESPRANFQFAQITMTMLDSPAASEDAYALAREHFHRAVTLDPNNVDGLFGLLVLELHVGRMPDGALVRATAERLRRINFGPLNVSMGQFSYLVEWHLSAEPKMPKEQMLDLFKAPLDNPTLGSEARAGLYNVLRAYHHRVLGELEPALDYGRLAVQTWPANWIYRDRLVKLLAAAGRWDEARRTLADATAADKGRIHAAEARALERLIEAARSERSGTPGTTSRQGDG